MMLRRPLLVAGLLATSLACQPIAVCRSEADCAPDGVCTNGVCVIAPTGMGDGGRTDAGPRLDAGPGDSGLVDAGGVDSGTPDAGTPDGGTVDAGSDGGGVSDAGLPFDAGSCVSCPDGFACDEALRACTLQVQALVFARPDANDVYGGGRPVRLEVRAELDASVILPLSLQLVATPPDFTPPILALQPGVATWAVDTVTPADGGTWALSARLVFGDAGFEARTQLTVDARRPVVTLATEPAPARVNDGGFSDRDPVMAFSTAFKKDELVELRVEATVPVRVSAADFGLPAQSLSPRVCSGCPANRSCQCFSVDLARLRLDAFRGVIDAGVGPLADALGNLSDPANVAVPVTRWKWRRILLERTQTAVDLIHPPALDEDGRVHVGVGFSNGQGSLWQMLPTGETRIDIAIDKVWAQPMVAGRVLYAQGNNSDVRRYDTVQMTAMPGVMQSAGATVCNNEKWEGTSSLVDERLFLMGVSGRVWSGAIAPLSTCEYWLTQPSFPSDSFAPKGVLVGQVLAGTAARLYFGRPELRLTGGMTRVDFFPAATPRFQQEKLATASQGVTSLIAFDDVVASTSRTVRTTIALSVWNADLSARVDARIAGDAGTTFGPLVATGPRAQPTFVFGDALGTLRRFPYTPPPAGMPDGGAFGAELMPITGVDALEGGTTLGMAAPVLGGNGLAYMVSPATGRLSVVNVATGQLEWTQPNAFTPGAVSPALDVVRDRMLMKQCGRGIGLLYVAVRNDSAVTAVIVDSPGLDGTSPWPRFHHDNGNTGNPETPLTPWSCP